MEDWVKRALTRKGHRKGARGAFEDFEITPNEELVYGVKFAIGMTVCLSAIEIAHMAFLHSWNSEVFTAMTGLTGLVTGILIGHRVSAC
ncbi:MAG: hypothetical protein ABSB89_05285 [Candidatus Bathyarchaeia archaeon]|jgi:hypothetical protein